MFGVAMTGARSQDPAMGTECLRAFAVALRREAHVLTRRPDLTWQQMHNRLQGEDPAVPIVVEQRARRSEPGSPPWMWASTPALTSPHLVQTLLNDEVGWLRACAISGDGAFVVAGSEAGQDPASPSPRDAEPILVVWDLATGEQRSVLPGHDRDVWGCAVGPDPSWVASASHDGSIRIWDPATGTERAAFRAHEGTALSCAISPDGSSIASCGQGGAKLWQVGTWNELVSLNLAQATGTIRALAFAPDGSSVLVGVDARLGRWDVSTGDVGWLGREEDRHDTVIDDCAVSADGTWATSVAGGEMRIWDLRTGACLRTLPEQDDWVEACAISPDGALLVSAGRDATLRLWDPVSGDELAVLRGHEGWVEDCAVTPDGTRVVSVGRDRTVRIWNVPPRIDEPSPASVPAGVEGCAVHAKASWVVFSGPAPVVLGGTLEEPKTALSVYPRRPGGYSFALAPGGDVAVIGGGGKCVVWVTASGEEVGRLSVTWSSSAGADVCAMAPDGTWLIASAMDRLRVWDLRTRSARGMLRAGTDPVTELAFSHSGAAITDCIIGPDGRWAVSADAGDQVLIWGLDVGGSYRSVPGMGRVCAASPDGGWIVAGGSDGAINLGDLAGASEPRVIGAHPDAVNACAVSPDGSWVLSAGEDRSLRVWDPASGAGRATVFLGASIDAVVAHPWKPWVACLTAFGDVFVKLVGIEYGPIVVTAREPGRKIRCPACGTERPVRDEELGTVSPCENASCSLLLRVNPFVARPGPPEGLFDDTADELRREYGDT